MEHAVLICLGIVPQPVTKRTILTLPAAKSILAQPHPHWRHTPVQSRHQIIWHKRGGDVWAGALREHSKLAFIRPVFETALFCKCLPCQVLDCSLKQAQYLNDEGLVSLASRPQLVLFKSGHQDAVHVFVISRSAELSGKKQFTFLGGRKKASTKTTSFWQIQTHLRESLFAGTRELEMFPQAH